MPGRLTVDDMISLGTPRVQTRKGRLMMIGSGWPEDFPESLKATILTLYHYWVGSLGFHLLVEIEGFH